MERVLAAWALVWRLAAQAPEAELKALIEAAQRAEQREDLETAADAYRKILRLRPGWASAEFNLGLVYHSQRKYGEAVVVLEQALRHNPQLHGAHLFLGASYAAMREYEKALPPLERYAQLEPASEEATALLAECYCRLGRHAPCVVSCLRRIRRAPNEPEPYYWLRESYLALANECLRELSLAPAAAHFRELFAAEELASPEAAEAELTRFVERFPDSLEGLLALGALQLRLGRAAGAAAAFEQARQRDPAAAPYLAAVRGAAPPPGPCPTREPLARTACLVAQGKMEEATTSALAWREAPARTPRQTYWAMHFFSRLASRAIDLLAERSPDSPLLAIIRARVFEQAGDLVRAEQEYVGALAGGADSDTLVEYGKFKCRNSEFDAAIALFEKALQLDAGRADVHALLGEVYMIRGEAAKALPHVQTAVERNPVHAQARIYWAQALHKLGRTREAITVLKAAPADPDGRIHYLLARYLAQQGLRDEAASALAVFREKRRSAASPSPLGSLTGAAAPGP
jgi:tetratricopeptide (TPR) repeat protein